MTEEPNPKGTGPHVTLFIAGGAPRSAAARRNLSAALQAVQKPSTAAMRVDVIDVLVEPAKALDVGLLATPSLSLTSASGHRRWFVGDLSHADMLAAWLIDALGPRECDQ